MRTYLTWLRKAMDRLDKRYAVLSNEPMLVEEVCSFAGTLADEAGQRAAKLGLSALYDESLDLLGAADPLVVKSFLAKCIAACEGKGEQKAWYSVPEVATLLTVEPAKVRAWIAQGELKASNGAKNPSGKVRWKISQAALDEFLRVREHSRSPTPVKSRRSYVKLI